MRIGQAETVFYIYHIKDVLKRNANLYLGERMLNVFLWTIKTNALVRNINIQ